MKLYVANMLSRRCKTIVESEFHNIGLYGVVEHLGEVSINKKPTAEQYTQLKEALSNYGFELLDENNSRLIEQLKLHIEEKILHFDKYSTMKFPVYLQNALQRDYIYLSNLFSRVRQMTIEQYIISTKIELAKELLLYEGLNLTEISYRMDYSSVAHLSNQFRKITGKTPSRFKSYKNNLFKSGQSTVHHN